ncbi:acyl-CoA dehydrogenase family protein [Paraconexibacter antarcticus]|uniref:Acyl-CoA dehydrogenase family protein n=1 Tax=Paraconexibacter antarcticus TaxID=2949664 RepID=A0ABY5DYQ6_9ACTN|nr:acyl-CoA dehydrogenase family protein [Paraconexibacter antarcticus]UTI66694.1 acyl-CoA dehydrogenase family protein [Paraconexibacter antarcticus]
MSTVVQPQVPCILSDELEDFRASVRSFAQAKLAPGYLDRALSDETPREVRSMLAAQGLIGVEVSPEYGGQGADHLAAGIACEEVARADFNAAYMVFSSTVEGCILAAHSPLADELLPRIVKGELKLCLGLTEPGSGSDAAAMSTTATRVDGGWRLNGEKTSVTGLPSAHMAIVFARTDRGPTGFLVDLEDPTVSRQRFRDPGLRPVGRGAVTFEDTFVPEERLLGVEGRGFGLVMKEFDYTRSLLGLMAIAVAERAIELTVAYAQERTTFGRPLSEYQGITFPIAEHLTKLEAARWLCYRALSLRIAGRPHTKEAAMVKWWGPHIALQAIEECIVIHGHVGWSDEMPLQAMRRDVSALLIGDGTPQIQKLIIARDVFGREPKTRTAAPTS